jgi:hypothetical protein
LGRPVRDAEDGTSPLAWLKKCDKDHMMCRTRVASTFRPTRLIDVGSHALPGLRLRDGTQCSGPYATLSYCWGKTHHNLTTRSTLHASMTGLEISSLCKTMRDAIIVTRNLQLKYLWIDALCIIQDDPADWEREALSMSDVYAQSAITIAATSSSDSNGGLFFPRRIVPTAQLLWTFPDSSPPERVNFRSPDASRFTSLYDKSPLIKRGWVLQERVLSKRTLHFTTTKLYWNCREAVLEEGSTQNHERDHFDEYTPESASFDLGSEESDGLCVHWINIIRAYTRMKLTYKSDRLPALSGLAKAWGTASNVRYIAGCWQKNLHLYLIWRAYFPDAKSSVPLQPSWSWVSVDGPVYFRVPTKLGEVVSLVNDIVVTINGSSTSASYGEVEEGILELTGRVKATVYTKEGAGEFGIPWDMALDERDHYYRKQAWFDRAPKLGGNLIILRLCEYEHGSIWTEYVMLLEQVEGEAYFKRVGMGEIVYRWPAWDRTEKVADGNMTKESWFDDVPDVRVKIH